MIRQPVTSSAIRSVGHHGDELEVEWQTGVVHRYTGVPRHIYEHLLQAKSIGKRFAANIRGHYPCVVVPPRPKK